MFQFIVNLVILGIIFSSCNQLINQDRKNTQCRESFMNKNVEIAEAYYTAMGKKNIAEMEKYLHPNVRIIGPLGEMNGKEVVVDSLKKLIIPLKAVMIRTKCGSNDHAVLICDLEFSEPIGKLPSAICMTFQDGLIIKNELFFDARKYEKKN